MASQAGLRAAAMPGEKAASKGNMQSPRAVRIVESLPVGRRRSRIVDSRYRGWRHRAVTTWVAAACALSPCAFAPARAATPPSEATAAAVDPAAALEDDLAGMSRELADARALFDDKVAMRADSALEMLNRAQVAFFEEDYPLAVARLLELTARPDFQRSPGYGEALTWLGEAMWQLGFRAAAAAELRRALVQPALPSAYRHTFSRYLALAGPDEPLEALRNAWQRYQSGRPDTALEPEDREVRYRYAKALFRGGALAEADALFAAIAQGDPYALHALYFQGVIQVSRDELKDARVTFETALEAWTASRPKAVVEAEAARAEDPPDWWDVEAGGGPELAVEEVAPVDPESVLDEALQGHARMGQVIQLALARLDASTNRLDTAVAHYRAVPPGSPDHAAATQELIWALYRRGEYARGARLIDQLLAGRGEDRTAAELSIWKAHLLALSADYEGSEANYRQLETALDRRRDELEADLSRDTRVFPEAVLAWTDAGTTSIARGIEADIVEQEESLLEAREIVTLLRTVSGTTELLPGVRAGKAVHTRLGLRLEAFRARLGGTPPGPLPAPERVAAMVESANRLGERLARFSTSLDEAEGRWRVRIREVLAEEIPNLDTLERRLGDQTALARRLGMAMAVGARQRLDDYAADAHFRQIDLAWWRVDEMRRLNKDARKAQRELLEPMEREVQDFRRERKDDPIPYVDESEIRPE